MRVILKNGSVTVTHPGYELLRELAVFGSDGNYHELYSYSKFHKTLVTMPGFAERIVDDLGGAYGGYLVEDKRAPLPAPDIEKSVSGIDEQFRGHVSKAIVSGGGVIAVPDVIGFPAVAASIISAYGRQGMIDRGTPISVVAVKDSRSSARVVDELRKLRKRDVCRGADGDDILVVPYGSIRDVPRNYVGILICEDALGCSDPSMVEAVSSFREAARWGICESAFGGLVDLPLEIEGLFGKVVASVKYSDAVEAGICAPVTVCWLRSPPPVGPSLNASYSILSRVAMKGNPSFISMLSRIMNSVSGETGVVLCTDKDVSGKVSKLVGGSVDAWRVPGMRIVTVMRDIQDGVVRRAIAGPGVLAGHQIPHGVMILATCAGRDLGEVRFPWRRSLHDGDKAYLVDFSHGWDLRNGRPGVLARNDKARRCLYEESGFNQIDVQDVEHLPFL